MPLLQSLLSAPRGVVIEDNSFEWGPHYGVVIAPFSFRTDRTKEVRIRASTYKILCHGTRGGDE